MGTATDKDSFTQARIRVNEAGAYETRDALEHYEHYLQGVRKLMMEEGFTDAIPQLNRKLGSVRRVLEETARTINEAGW